MTIANRIVGHGEEAPGSLRGCISGCMMLSWVHGDMEDNTRFRIIRSEQFGPYPTDRQRTRSQVWPYPKVSCATGGLFSLCPSQRQQRIPSPRPQTSTRGISRAVSAWPRNKSQESEQGRQSPRKPGIHDPLGESISQGSGRYRTGREQRCRQAYQREGYRYSATLSLWRWPWLQGIGV